MPAIRIIVWRRDPASYNTDTGLMLVRRKLSSPSYSQVSYFIFWLMNRKDEDYSFFFFSFARSSRFDQLSKASSQSSALRERQQVRLYEILLRKRFDYITSRQEMETSNARHFSKSGIFLCLANSWK